MKLRFPLLLLLAFLVASTAAWADTVVVGTLDLFNNGTLDTLQLTNTTGQTPAPTNTVADALTFSNLSLTINGHSVSFDTTQEPVTAPYGTLDFGDLFAPGSINSLALTGNWSGPTTVTVNGVQETLLPGFSASYSGPGLAEGASINVLAQTQPTVSAPEPAVMSLFGFAAWFLRRRRITG